MSPRPECSGPINITHRFTANRVKKSHQATNRTENAVQLARNIEKKLNATRDAQVQRLPFLAQRFVFLHELGTGVFLCKDIKAKKRIMCRVFRSSCSDIVEAHFRLSSHPFINKLHGVIRRGDKTFVFSPMPYDDLLSYVRRTKTLSEQHARYLFRQICLIVKSCHENGIVLRDLKMRKFVFNDLRFKILKLELLMDAVVLKDPSDDLLREKRGCPVYVAPEILKPSETYYGKAADMWSLGVILYTMLVGRYPFNDQQHTRLFAKISRGEFSIPESLSPEARCMIRSLLIQDPQKRLTADDILHHPWMTCDMNSEASSKANLSPTDQCVPEFNA
ncbi:unnamed protein product [Hermetia illucens]|uniref:Protein kinase domain-containing protein n=1 Tax=Hermetia illucens TaxID=343691 RepID=A0A7R8US31_HERIL|nr:tribbles homolog 2-like [Hermetia illucens]XP_037910907.1 tribbles homolog 2-like [Hermetia illucens]XP_037910910.1 tribbles homolog 2-like [Hermetia illucens]XP_037910911.1 tribbles homolog 2-like [Hermetia illucens]XP_037910912.1 tribbles homolog 2-like [Hermetia illucens]CAD7085685.1 unnamed protein product [Hermetia illucens]